ncbi:MAG: RNA methyltransferase [Oscillospiraceae bacterium]
MEQITSKDNRWIKEYGKLSSSKSYRDKQSLFVVESVKLIVEAFNNNQCFEMVFVTQTCFEKYSHELEKLFQLVQCYIITEEISKKITGLNSPQGIYGVCQKCDKQLAIDKIYSDGKYIMLVDLQDTGNVGAIIRTAEALGINGIIMTNKSCDIYNPKVIRGSMGSVFRMEFMITDEPNALLTNFKHNNVKTYASIIHTEATSLPNVKFTSPSVLLIGNEGNGLTTEMQALCSEKITINMAGNAESLNASMAACILMWEMTK